MEGKATNRGIPRLVVYLVANVFIGSTILLYIYASNYSVVTRYSQPAYGDYRPLLQRRDDGDTSVNNNKALSSKGAPTPSLGSATPPTCYKQVQIWKGSKDVVKPKDYACPGVKCGIRYVEAKNMKTMRNSHAVVFYHRSNWDWAEMHKHRPPGQKWLFYTRESPIHTKKAIIPPEPYYSNSYDYTIGYRDRATFDCSYGYYDPTEPEIASDEPRRNWAAEKPRQVAWMASNCGTTSWRRREFVLALSKHIKVDMYGACGNKRCPRKSEDCIALLQTYKFYMAIENSECRDYITEKFWRNSLLNGIVPVAYGTMKKDYERVAPPNSFIHLHDFKSVKEVADYLHKVAANDTLYNSYLEWKLHGSVKVSTANQIIEPQYLCRVVDRLVEDEAKEATGIPVNYSVPNLNSWWRDSCKNVGTGFPRNF